MPYGTTIECAGKAGTPDATAQSAGPPGIGHRPRVHGHVGLLRHHGPERGHRDHPTRPGDRRHLPRHRAALRPAHQRVAGRRGDQGPPRRVRDRHQVQLPDGRRGAGRHEHDRAAGRLGRACPQLRPRLAGAPGHRPHRPVLPAPGRPRGAHRGDGRCPRGAGGGGQGAAHRAERGERGDDPARPCRPPDHRGAERVLAVDAGRGGRGAARLPGAGHRLRAVLAARPRFPRRPLLLRRGPGRERLPPQQPPLCRRQHRREPAAGGEGEGDRRGEGRDPGPAGDRLGAGPGRGPGPDPGHQAPHLPGAERGRGRRRADQGGTGPHRRGAARGVGRAVRRGGDVQLGPAPFEPPVRVPCGPAVAGRAAGGTGRSSKCRPHRPGARW